jgi:hypothetical protein
MEAHMSWREYIEWLSYFNSGGASGSGNGSGSSWQKQMQVMRVVSELQKLRGAA